jgi:prevent-host-death family protein
MAVINLDAARTHLTRLIERACEGEEIVIAVNNEPVVKLVPLAGPRPRRQRGSLEGRVVVHDTYFDRLPPEDLDAWSQ